MKIYSQYKFLTLFAMLTITAALAAASLLNKLIQVGRFLFDGGAFILPFVFLLTDIIVEVYGYEVARKVMVFGNSLAVEIISTIGIIFGNFLNAILITKWKILLKGRYFWIRSIGSSTIGEAVQLVLVCLTAGLLNELNVTANILKNFSNSSSNI